MRHPWIRNGSIFAKVITSFVRKLDDTLGSRGEPGSPLGCLGPVAGPCQVMIHLGREWWMLSTLWSLKLIVSQVLYNIFDISLHCILDKFKSGVYIMCYQNKIKTTNMIFITSFLLFQDWQWRHQHLGTCRIVGSTHLDLREETHQGGGTEVLRRIVQQDLG